MKRSLTITLGLVLAIIGLTGGAARATSYTNTIAQVRAYITNQMAVNNIQGVSIALVDDQTVVWSYGFGQADREGGVAADADTVYHIGSVSKSFAATAVMQLMDAELINIEQPLTNYMAEFSMLPRFTNSGPVTIRSLLNHHSGLPGDLFNTMWTTPLRDDYVAWLISYLQGDYTFAPVNERYEYCNTGWVLLSDVVRRLDGRSFAAATDARIFTPLGMTASSFIPDKPAISNRLAACYDGAGNRQPMEYVNCLGSGSMYSSANDMAKYIRMILADGRYDGQAILSTNALAVMTNPQLTNLPLNISDGPQGLGWDNADDARFRYAGRVIWKDGATIFYCSFLGISRDLKLGVAVIQNSPGSQCDAIGAETLRWAILDKIGQPWPTNTFVPTNSPVTTIPQTNLDALVGLYVGGSGYHKVVSAPGTLTLIANADSDTPDITSNLVPRANGWFSKSDSQSNQLAFTNLAGHDMLVLHAVEGPRESVSPLGERYVPGPLPTVWSARTNRIYRQVDMYPADYTWGLPNSRRLRLSVKDGALLATWASGAFVMDPQSDTLAFQRGVHYRSGGAIRVFTTNGYELLQHASCRFLDEAAIPNLAVSTVTSGAIPFANGTQWYWFTGQTGKTYRVRIAAPGREVFLRITDREGIVLGAGTNAPATFACTSNGTYAIAVSAINVFSFTVSLTVVGSRQMQDDYDGDGKADPAVYDSASGWFTVFQSGSNYVASSVIMGVPPTAYSLQPVPGDFDGDGKADPAVYDPIANQLLARYSSQAYRLYTMPIGDANCVPVAGDFDGDGKSDPALYSAATGQMAAWQSGSAYAAAVTPLGGEGWSNASEDYDGDGKTDPAVFETASGTWEVLMSGNYYLPSVRVTASGAGVMPAPGDYDGDGKADLALFQPETGMWLFALSGQSYAQQTIPGGLAGAGLAARPGDYDNDGKTDPAVCDPGARVFYVWYSGSNYRRASLSW